MQGRGRRHAKVDVLALNGDPDAPVLRQAALGNIQASHDLHARNDRRGEISRVSFELTQQPVHA